jgi:hypothetical protein
MRERLARTRSAITGDTRITLRLLIFAIAVVVGSSMAPVPWAQIALVGLLGLVIDTVLWRTRRTT